MSKDQQALLKDYETHLRQRGDRIAEQLTAHGANVRRTGYWNALRIALLGNINYMRCKTPSAHIVEHASYIFSDMVYPRHREAFLAMADGVLSYPYAVDMARRPFRSGDYRIYEARLVSLFANFLKLSIVDADIKDILTGNLPAAARAYIAANPAANPGFPPELLAYQLDQNDPELEEIVIEILNGEGTFAAVSRPLIQGIVMSRSARAHEGLCKLLLAARLQEGLRQSICESADQGSKEGFFAIVKTIREHDLMRYSSVKRAVGTWLGLLSETERDLDRISNKSLDLMIRCLEDGAFRDESLASEDAMAIYAALWSYAFHDVQDAANRLVELSRTGTHHQKLTAGYFVANLENDLLAHTIARLVLKENRDRYDLLAVYLPHFLPHSRQMAMFISQNKSDAQTPFYFESVREQQEFCDWLLETFLAMKKKELVFSPCVFPWHSAVLRRSELLEKAMVIATLMENQTRIDQLCQYLPETEGGGRSFFFSMLTRGEKTPAVRAAIVAGLMDKESLTRAAAMKRCRGLRLTDEEYLALEDGLRLKSSSIRQDLMELLLEQEAENRFATIRRLLSDKRSEKRLAGLDMLTQLKKRGEAVDACLDAVRALSQPTTQEKLLMDALLPQQEEKRSLYSDDDEISTTVAVDETVRGYAAQFLKYFPESSILQDLRNGAAPAEPPVSKQECPTALAARQHLQAMSQQYREWTKEITIAASDRAAGEAVFGARYMDSVIYYRLSGQTQRWKDWAAEQKLSQKDLLAMWVRCSAVEETEIYIRDCGAWIDHIFGPGFRQDPLLDRRDAYLAILKDLLEETLTPAVLTPLAVALGTWIALYLPKDMILGHSRKKTAQPAVLQIYGAFQHFENDAARAAYQLRQLLQEVPSGHFIAHPQLRLLLGGLGCCETAAGRYAWHLLVRLNVQAHRALAAYCRETLHQEPGNSVPILQDIFGKDTYITSGPCPVEPKHHLFARFHGIITQRQLYRLIMRPNSLRDALTLVTSIQAVRPEEGQTVSARCFAGYRGHRLRRCYEDLTKNIPTEEEKLRLIDLCRLTARELVEAVLEPELRRGDSPAQYSDYIKGIQTLSGQDYFVRILKALGRDTLDRTASEWYSGNSRRGNLSWLLSRCAPDRDDTAESLRLLLSGTDITDKRLIEAAMYSPAWIDLVGSYVGIPGFRSACYFFMAHMKEDFDDDKKAAIARFTPLTPEELNDGAFDIHWFRSAYAELGEGNFELLYDAAKYISDGSKHARARKFADAALGRLDIAQTEAAISDKRNKDLLMAYPAIPLIDDDDLSRRYLFIQSFLKQSRTFGAQRSASEKKASETALRNLATNAGFSDPMRLTLRMENRLTGESAELLAPHAVGDWVFRLTVDGEGAAAIECRKDGKLLKSIPAGAKKDPWVVRLQETKKQLTEQYRRSRRMLEQAMEDGVVFTLGELAELAESPVVGPIVRKLALLSPQGAGFLEDGCLRSCNGSLIADDPDTKLTIAHPADLHAAGVWTDFQRYLYDRRIIQPFRQVFRELYVPTAEEKSALRSLRYAGHQIQPKKAAACLKERRWIADVESGLQKVYYQAELVATIFALADWFTPADIEAPALEHVAFFNRRTGEPVKIEDVPPIIFSETMRDVDLAVSVAHVGGVDPEASHSTVEMRAAIVSFTAPLLGLANVTVEGNHAVIKGKLGQYLVHLGSGVAHQLGGTMLSILPVHSQHRGRLFLPFVDDDPQTAEILSKILLLSEDHKLKDPSILAQIRRDIPESI